MLQPEFDDLDAAFPLCDGTADVTAVIACPYCWQPVEIELDPGSGSRQSYVEDCSVCCRPMELVVAYDHVGHASVSVEAED